jgi:hypothetical protein
VGWCALVANTTGINNNALGAISLRCNTTGACNVAMGNAAVCANTTGSNNTGIGRNALRCNTTADNNTAVGFDSLCCNTTGTLNVAVGTFALCRNTASSNTAVGHGALSINSTGTLNVGLGNSSLGSITTGSNTTAVGFASGYEITTGSNNLLLGKNAGRSTSPSGSITTGSNNVVLGDNNITDLYCADTTISSSDQRDKADITDFTHGLDFVTKLNPKTYKWDKRSWYITDDNQSILDVTPDGTYKKDRVNIGFMAQDVLALENEIGYGNSKKDMLFVSINEDETAYGLKYERLVPVLVNAIKELTKRIEELENK